MIKDDKNVSRKSKKKKKRSISVLIVIACIALTGYFLYTIVSLNASIQQWKARENELVQKNEDQKKKGEGLKDEIDSIGTNEFIEKHARDIFGYVKENEKLFFDINDN